MLAVPEIQPVKIRRNVWWVLTVPEMRSVNLEGMYGEPIRDNNLGHMCYVYQSEMVGPVRNPPNMVFLVTLLTNHKPPFFKNMPIYG